jgi:hypothetical protein
MMVSCQEKAPEIDISAMVSELKIQGKFETANYTFLGNTENKEHSLIKITFSNSNIKNFNQNEFGEKAGLEVFLSK